MKFVIGLIVGAVLLCAAAFIYVYFGYIPVATAAKGFPFEQQIAMHSLHARAHKEMPKTAAIQADASNYTAGAQVYMQHCALCHGSASEKSQLREAMYPRPPQLFQGDDVTDDPPGMTFWKVQNGIRMTAMPSFQHILSEQQMWQVSLLLATDKLPPEAKAPLMAPAPKP